MKTSEEMKKEIKEDKAKRKEENKKRFRKALEKKEKSKGFRYFLIGLRWALVALIGYIGAIFLTINIIPSMTAVVGHTVGITPDTKLLDVFAFWAVPMLFLVGIMIGVYFFAMYWLNKLLKRWFS